MRKWYKPLLILQLLKNRQITEPLSTKELSYQQNHAFPLLLLALLRNPYKFVVGFNKMFNQFY